MNTSVYVKSVSKNLESNNLKVAVEKISRALKRKETADAEIAYTAYNDIQKYDRFKIDGFKDYSGFCKSVFGWNKSTACNYAKIGRLFTEKRENGTIAWAIDGFNKTAWIQFSRLFDSELDETIRLKSVDELKTFITEKTLFNVPVTIIKSAIDKYVGLDNDSENQNPDDSENQNPDDSENQNSVDSENQNSVDAFKTAFDAIMDSVKYLSEYVIPVDSENQKLLVSIVENLNIMVETR